MLVKSRDSCGSAADTTFEIKKNDNKSSVHDSNALYPQKLNRLNTFQNLGSNDEMKPFFIMDWLDQIDANDLKEVQKMLQKSRLWKRNEHIAKNISSSKLTSPTEKLRSVKSAESFLPVFPTLKKAKSSPFLERSIEVGNSWNAKGLRKAKGGAWAEALRCWQNALEIRTQVLGDAHIDVANTLNNIGIAQGKLHSIHDAIESLRRALAIRVEHFGTEHEEVATTLHNIGNIFQQGNDLEAAVNCFCVSKQLHEKLLGPDHIQVARACVAMGHTYHQAREYRDAREAYLDALIIFERAGLSKADIEVQNTLIDVQELDRITHKTNT